MNESILFSSVSVSFCDIVNHDFRAMMPTDGLDEFKSVAIEPVSVGNDNRRYRCYRWIPPSQGAYLVQLVAMRS